MLCHQTIHRCSFNLFQTIHTSLNSVNIDNIRYTSLITFVTLILILTKICETCWLFTIVHVYIDVWHTSIRPLIVAFENSVPLT